MGGYRAFFRSRSSVLLPIAVVLILTVIFSLGSPAFLTMRNFDGISSQSSALLIASLGATFVILMGSIDLSVGSVVMFCGAIAAALIARHGFGSEVLIVSVVVGGLCGLASGLLFAFGRIPSFIVTLGMLSVLNGLALTILEGRALAADHPGFWNLAIGKALGLPNVALWALGAWAAMVLVGLRTRFGRYMYAIGGGEAVARTSGIPVRRYQVYAFVLSGMTSGLAAALMVARLGSAGPALGSTLLLDSLAAVVVGGTSLSGGVGGVQRTLIGVLIIAMLDNGLNLMGVHQYTQLVTKGVVVIGAVLLSQVRAKQTIIK